MGWKHEVSFNFIDIVISKRGAGTMGPPQDRWQKRWDSTS
jgi:hypothetical protein